MEVFLINVKHTYQNQLPVKINGEKSYRRKMTASLVMIIKKQKSEISTSLRYSPGKTQTCTITYYE